MFPQEPREPLAKNRRAWTFHNGHTNNSYSQETSLYHHLANYEDHWSHISYTQETLLHFMCDRKTRDENDLWSSTLILCFAESM